MTDYNHNIKIILGNNKAKDINDDLGLRKPIVSGNSSSSQNESDLWKQTETIINSLKDPKFKQIS